MQFKTLLNLTGDKLYTLPLMVLYITDGCNSRCVTCDIWKNPRRNMPMRLVDELVASAEALKTRWVLLSGGEAMQHPQWAEIARTFRDAGVRVMLLTNGLLVKKQAQQVIDTVDDLIVSLDGGTAETYHAIRGVDAFDLILEGIQHVREGGVSVTTRTTVQQANFREIPQIIQAGLDVDVNSISFLAVDVSNPYAFGDRFESEVIPLIASSGNGAPAEHGPPAQALDSEDVDELSHIIDQLEMDYADAFADGRIAESPDKLRRILVRYFGALNHETTYPSPPCNAPHFSTVIEVDGTLRPCYFLPSYGRLKPDGESLSDALNWEPAQQLRYAYRTGQRVECTICVCPLHKSPRNLLRMG